MFKKHSLLLSKVVTASRKCSRESWRRKGRRAEGARRDQDCRGAIEALEDRLLLSATAAVDPKLHVVSQAPGLAPTGNTWTDMTNAVPNSDGSQLALLLPNGTLMVHGTTGNGGGESANWYKVTPDGTGGYANGTWTQLASMHVQRLYFGSTVLLNGNVFVVGGEYATDQSFSRSAEIYNPATNVWTVVASSPKSQVGDEPTELLPNGNVLVGDIADDGTEIYDPATNAWSAGGTKIRNDQSDEEPWVKLPNGDILTYDLFASISGGKGLAEIYNPTTNTWSDASNGTLPVLSSAQEGYELGPAVLLPDGRVYLAGANGQSAYYNYTTNSWSQGPTLPVVTINGTATQLTAGDAPAAVMPNGDVLVALAPAVNNGSFPGPTFIYDFNPTTNTFTDVTPSSSLFYLANNSYVNDMLVLPTGQVMLTNFGGDPVIYTPSGSPNAAWKPTISSFTNNGNGSYTLTGTQLNGLDEGAAYGDDNQMAENYPLVQVTDTSTQTVYFATTSNWSSTGVATGSASETVNVVLPAALGSDPYTLVVIANGIASSPFSSTSNPPSISAPSTVSVGENASLTFSGGNAISVSDTGGTSEQLTLTVQHGTLTLGTTTGLTVTGNGTASVLLSGTLSTLNSDLTSLSYTPTSGYSGSDTLSLSDKDTTDTLTGSNSVAITVSPLPSVTAPSNASVYKNHTLTFSAALGDAITLADGAATGTSTDSLTLQVVDGRLKLATTSGIKFTSGANNSASMTVTGTLANLNAALNGLIYTPTSTFVGSDSLQITLKDPRDNLTGSGTVSIAVNTPPAPVVTAPATASTTQNTSLTFSTAQSNAITLSDAYYLSTYLDQVTLKVGHGTLTLATTSGITFLSGANGTASMKVKGTLAALNAALNGLVYTPTTGFKGTASMSISLKDTHDSLTGSATVAISVVVAALGAPSSPGASTLGAPLGNSAQGTAADNFDLWDGDQAAQWAGLTAAVDVLNA
jgi:hypothetical protein